MKALRVLLVVVVLGLSFNISYSQSAKQQKKDAKAAAIKNMIDSASYVFVANYVTPLRGGQRVLTSEYDVRVSPDSVITFLPYYGRAYLAPNDIPLDGGIKFTTTNFKYTTTAKKNGTWEIRIKPKDNNITDWRDVQQLFLTVGSSGYATLNVISSNRDQISFYGTIERQKRSSVTGKK